MSRFREVRVVTHAQSGSATSRLITMDGTWLDLNFGGLIWNVVREAELLAVALDIELYVNDVCERTT